MLAKGFEDFGLFKTYFPHGNTFHKFYSDISFGFFKIYYFIISSEFKEAEWEKIPI